MTAMDSDIQEIRRRCLAPTKYAIARPNGEPLCGWDDPAAGYPPAVLRAMRAAGYLYLVDGAAQRAAKRK